MFKEWLESEGYSHGFKVDVLRYLERYVLEVKEPFDIVRIFSKVNKGKRHVVLALRTFQFL
jgi:hypothetical protein